MTEKQFKTIDDRFHREAVSKNPINTKFYKEQAAALKRSAQKIKETHGTTDKYFRRHILRIKCELLLMEHENIEDNGEKIDEYFDMLMQYRDTLPVQYYKDTEYVVKQPVHLVNY